MRELHCFFESLLRQVWWMTKGFEEWGGATVEVMEGERGESVEGVGKFTANLFFSIGPI